MNKWFGNDGLKENIKHDARLEYLKNPHHIYAPFDEVWCHFRQFEMEKLRTYDLFAQNRVKETAVEVVLNFGWRDNCIVMLLPVGENIYIPELPYWRDDKSNPHVSQGWFVNGDQLIDPANYKVEADVYVEQHWYQAKPTFFQRLYRRLGLYKSK